MNEVISRDGRAWSQEICNSLPWCFWDELSMNGWTPHGKMIAWASDLLSVEVHRNGVSVLEPLAINPSDGLRPHVCYHTAVIFYLPGTVTQIAQCDHPSRTWPNISFVMRDGLFYEVISGRVLHVFDKWHFEWRCRKNTDVARHFNRHCDRESCRYCKLLARKEPA